MCYWLAGVVQVGLLDYPLSYCGVCPLALSSIYFIFHVHDTFLSLTHTQESILQCVHMPRVNLEGAVLKGCSMDERLGVSTNLEGEYIDW